MSNHRSVEFYEQILNKSILDALRRNPSQALVLGVSQETMVNAASLDEILKAGPLSPNAVNSMILSSISSLMLEYKENTGVTSSSTLSIFRRNANHNMRKACANEVILAVYSSLVLAIQGASLRPCIDRIKRALSDGVLDPNISPMDNFPNLVRAIINQTRDIPGWTFDLVVIHRLNPMVDPSFLKKT